jgi:hypothetical protein
MTVTLDASDLDMAGGAIVLGDASIEMVDGALEICCDGPRVVLVGALARTRCG